MRVTFAWRVFVCALVLLMCVRNVRAVEAWADDPKNARWHTLGASSTVVFLPSSDAAQSATMVLKKQSVLDQTLTINSDASYISVQCGSLPRIVIKPGFNSPWKLRLTGGDLPSVWFNDQESLPQQGKWIQMLSAPESTVSLELGAATYAKIMFEAPAASQPVVAAPPPPALPTKNLLPVVTPAQLANASRVFDNGIRKRCVSCNGTGWVTNSVVVGSHHLGAFSVPDYGTRRERCTLCNGTGIDRAVDAVLIRLSGNLVSDVAALNHDAPTAQQVLTDTYDTITKDMIGDRKTWTLLTANGRSILAQKKPAPGTPVVAMVDVKSSEKPSDDHRCFLVRVLGTDNRVYVDDPTLADELKNGKALMGGVIDTPIDHAGAHLTSLHGGFLIAPPITHDWWWWYHDE